MPLADFKDRFPLLADCLLRARRAGTMAHAYIVHGDNPALREEFSLALAAMMVCESPKSDGDACGQCPPCRQVRSRIYQELYILEPVSKSRRITIGKANEPFSFRWFEDRFHLTSVTASGVKIGLILDADRMQPEAQNAFLKTLEEPPGTCLFILATGNPAAMLNTIRSRCQKLLLLTNQCDYDFDFTPRLAAALGILRGSRRSLAAAEDCAAELIGVAATLRQQAEAEVEERWRSKAAAIEAADSPTAVKKQFEEARKAAVEAAYRGLREKFLSAIHAYFAQIAQTRAGVPIEFLANPALVADAPAAAGESEGAAADLERAAELLGDLDWNVNESLAIRNFCLGIAFPKIL